MYTTIEHKHLDQVGSTNAWLKQSLHLCTKHTLFCVSADAQSNGHGRGNKQWVSEKGASLILTFGFRHDADIAHVGSIGQLLAIAFMQCIDPVPLMFKWPNDLYLSGKKCGGILSEVVKHDDHYVIICGIGVNVNNKARFVIDQPHTSIYLETQKETNLSTLIHALSTQFLEHLNIWTQKGLSPFLEYVNHHLLYKGEEVTITQPSQTINGTCTGITIDGALQIHTASQYTNVTSGSLTKD